jgi:hypothetical protein
MRLSVIKRSFLRHEESLSGRPWCVISAGILNFRNNGGSVPSFGGTLSLAAALQRVDAAEQALAEARAQAKAVAKREGRGTRNLFSEGRRGEFDG